MASFTEKFVLRFHNSVPFKPKESVVRFQETVFLVMCDPSMNEP